MSVRLFILKLLILVPEPQAFPPKVLNAEVGMLHFCAPLNVRSVNGQEALKT